MTMRAFVCVLFLGVCFFRPAFSTPHFTFSTTARQAYGMAASLRFDESLMLIEEVRRRDPDNLIILQIENYIDVLRIIINEDQKEFERLWPRRQKRLQKLESGNPSSPYYLYLQADIRLQWAVARLKFDEYLGAFTDVRKAYHLLERNQATFPDFMPNLKNLALLHAMVGTIPDNYQWGAKLLTGVEGSVSQGQRELERVLRYANQNEFVYEAETRIFYAYLLLHLRNQPQEAWEVIDHPVIRARSNPIHCFVKANIAMRSERNDVAISLLAARPAGQTYFPFVYLDFMLGLTKLRRLDDDADVPIRRFLTNYHGRNFIKEAYQKLAWYELIQGRPGGYQKNMHLCATQGEAISESDQNALLEAQSEELPELSLIKARLLFDGGYYPEAYAVLQNRGDAYFAYPSQRLEYYYRLGRILHGMGRAEAAIQHYQLTIEQGRDQPYFFACNAALQIGLLFEQVNEYAKAQQYFETCLQIKPKEYRTGLHQAAKAGLSRLPKK